jgi:hypothetical protein
MLDDDAVPIGVGGGPKERLALVARVIARNPSNSVWHVSVPKVLNQNINKLLSSGKCSFIQPIVRQRRSSNSLASLLWHKRNAGLSLALRHACCILDTALSCLASNGFSPSGFNHAETWSSMCADALLMKNGAVRLSSLYAISHPSQYSVLMKHCQPVVRN